MQIIAITKPYLEEGEVDSIKRMLVDGVDILHLRKPDSDAEGCRKILRKMTSEERKRIIIHDYPELYEEFSLKGIHINKNVTSLPEGYQGFKTRSCHSLEEVVLCKNDYDYVFLSPIFDSISKKGYKSNFTEEMLREASRNGIIDEKVVALGGVTLDKINFLKELNFGGAAMLGALSGV